MAYSDNLQMQTVINSIRNYSLRGAFLRSVETKKGALRRPFPTVDFAVIRSWL